MVREPSELIDGSSHMSNESTELLPENNQGFSTESIEVDKTQDSKALGYSGQRKIVKDKSNNFHIAYRKKFNEAYEVFVAKLSGDDGRMVSGTEKPIALMGVTQRVPSIAIDSQDHLHVVWYGPDSKKQKNNRQIKYSRSVDGGESWSEQANISFVSGYDSQEYWQEHPFIFVGNDDELYIVWEGKDINNKHQQVKFIKSLDYGETWSQWINIYLTSGNTQSRPIVLQGNNGRLHVLMYSSINQTVQQIRYVFSDDDGDSWSNLENISNSVFDARHISAAIDQTGKLHVAWRAPREISCPAQIHYCALSDNGWSDHVIISPSDNFQFFPSITTDKNNIPYIVWMESEKKYNFPKERPESGKIYFSYLMANKFSEAKLVSLGDYNFYPNFPDHCEESQNIAVVYLRGTQLLKIIFNQLLRYH